MTSDLCPINDSYRWRCKHQQCVIRGTATYTILDIYMPAVSSNGGPFILCACKHWHKPSMHMDLYKNNKAICMRPRGKKKEKSRLDVHVFDMGYTVVVYTCVIAEYEESLEFRLF